MNLNNANKIQDSRIVDSVEIDGIIIDYTKDRRIVAIEILDAGKRTVKDPLSKIRR
jgi:uncharacterized protein YuzE